MNTISQAKVVKDIYSNQFGLVNTVVKENLKTFKTCCGFFHAALELNKGLLSLGHDDEALSLEEGEWMERVAYLKAAEGGGDEGGY